MRNARSAATVVPLENSSLILAKSVDQLTLAEPNKRRAVSGWPRHLELTPSA